MTIISDLLKKASEELCKQGIENPLREARLLLAYVLKKSYEEVFFHPEISVNNEDVMRFNDFLNRRLKQEPLSKIIGKREFWGLSFKVTKDTLDPRPDSETLIKAVLKSYLDHQRPLRILDLGTGTGCLIISLLTEYPQATGVAVDLSLKALGVAEENRHTHQLNNRLHLLQSNWFDNVWGIFDIIISNPPYICKDEQLEKAVLMYDPAMALFSDNQGLLSYESIAECSRDFLATDGKIFLEIGKGQSEDVQRIFCKKGFKINCIEKDLTGIDRCLVVS